MEKEKTTLQQEKLIELFNNQITIKDFENTKKIINHKSIEYHTRAYQNYMTKSQWEEHFNDKNQLKEETTFEKFWIIIEYLLKYHKNFVFFDLTKKFVAIKDCYYNICFDLESETFKLYEIIKTNPDRSLN